jgi:lysylphosphatidylglycerol synthetase-like protein (DUF2156 family)
MPSLLNNGRLPAIRSTSGNISVPSNPPLRLLREQAVTLGVPNVQGIKTRLRLLEAIEQRKQQIESLRADCLVLGLSTDGDENVLRLRLAGTREGAVSANFRQAWQRAGYACLALAAAGLVVSLPHLAQGLGKITGVNFFYATVLAIVVDLGFVILKGVDVISGTFEVSKASRLAIRSLMIVCLAFSAIVNAVEFARTADSLALAILTSVFLAGFVFCMSTVGASMLMRCEPKKQPKQAEDPSAVFRQAAERHDELEKLAALHNKP